MVKTAFLMVLLLLALVPEAKAETDDQMAYCLTQKEIILKNIKEFSQRTNDPNLAAVKVYMQTQAEKDVQDKKRILAAHKKYFLDRDEPAAEVAPMMEQARADSEAYEMGDFGRCAKRCAEMNNQKPDKGILAACVQDCETFMTDTDRRFVSCGQ